MKKSGRSYKLFLYSLGQGSAFSLTIEKKSIKCIRELNYSSYLIVIQDYFMQRKHMFIINYIQCSALGSKIISVRVSDDHLTGIRIFTFSYCFLPGR